MMEQEASGGEEIPSKKKKKKNRGTQDRERADEGAGVEQTDGPTDDVEMGDDTTEDASQSPKSRRRKHTRCLFS